MTLPEYSECLRGVWRKEGCYEPSHGITDHPRATSHTTAPDLFTGQPAHAQIPQLPPHPGCEEQTRAARSHGEGKLALRWQASVKTLFPVSHWTHENTKFRIKTIFVGLHCNWLGTWRSHLSNETWRGTAHATSGTHHPKEGCVLFLCPSLALQA